MTETWVWIYLPGSLVPTRCGVVRHDGQAGRFVYEKSYLDAPGAVPLDPVLLPVLDQEYTTTHLGGWFSVMLDSGPDAWGRRLIDSCVGPQDQRGYLLHGHGEPAGALSFSASAETPPPTVSPVDLHGLEGTLELNARVEAGESLSSAELRDLLRNAGIGGARPKLTLEDEGVLWLAKGVSIRDTAELAPVPIVESVLLTLAGELGIASTDACLEFVNGGPVVLLRRFDRVAVQGGFARRRYVSGQTLLWSDPEVAKWSFQGSYSNLAKQIRRWEVSPEEDIRELYRRLVFNALVGNLDDHEKNHGLVADDDGQFHLTPVFDLTITATPGKRQMLAMPFGKEGAVITRENLLSECAEFGYEREEAEAVLHGQWDHVQKNIIERLVDSGCDELRARRTGALMPGHGLFRGIF